MSEKKAKQERKPMGFIRIEVFQDGDIEVVNIPPDYHLAKSIMLRALDVVVSGFYTALEEKTKESRIIVPGGTIH